MVLIEKHPQAAQVASHNAKIVVRAFSGTDESPAIQVARSSVQSYLDAAEDERFDVIMLDPPYDLGEAELAANLAACAALLADDGVLLVERSSRSPEPSWPEGLVQFKQKRYGETVLWWSEHKQQL